MKLDVCDDASVERAVAEIEKTAGPVDVLVNNAGIAIAAVMEEITLTDLRRQFETNYFGLVRMSQRVLSGMRRKLSGRIINMSSIAGKLVSPLFGPYSSSKHAVEAVSDAMRLEVYPFGIQVVLIEPGYIPTSMSRNAGELSSAYAKGAEQSPTERSIMVFSTPGARPPSHRDTRRKIAREWLCSRLKTIRHEPVIP